jgi:hypothetical protein
MIMADDLPEADMNFLVVIQTTGSSNSRPLPPFEYLPAATCNNDIINFWAPNIRCVEMMLADFGPEVSEVLQTGKRALFRAHLSSAQRSSEKIDLAYSLR